MKPCACYDTINAKLKPHNTAIKSIYIIESRQVGMPWPIDTVQIETGRGKPKAMSLIASFCPFCGTSLTGEAKKSKPALPEAGAGQADDDDLEDHEVRDYIRASIEHREAGRG